MSREKQPTDIIKEKWEKLPELNNEQIKYLSDR
jgi:hypothetical protein